MRRRRVRGRMTPSAQAAVLVRERHVVASEIGYTPFPWDIHPVDRRIRVPPSGPLSQAWQGVQKINEISKVGTRRASTYSPMRNPLQTSRGNTQRVQYQNWASYAFGGGPVVADQMDQATQDYWVAQAQAQESPLQTFLRRIRGY